MITYFAMCWSLLFMVIQTFRQVDWEEQDVSIWALYYPLVISLDLQKILTPTLYMPLLVKLFGLLITPTKKTGTEKTLAIYG